MSIKKFTQVSVLIVVLMAFFAVPAQAGGVCGGAYTVEQGETLESIASMCGTTASAITAANPGLGALTVGQVITVPGSNFTGSGTPVPGSTTTGTTTIINNYYTTNNYYNGVPGGSSTTTTTTNGTYIVQPGDTFASIAGRFGLSVNALWAANPGIRDINLLYIGQSINLPGSSTPSGGMTIEPVPTLIPRSWGTAPKGTGKADVKLVNKAESQVYVSLQGTMRDGSEVINEYPVEGKMTVRVPQGWYLYVAWVGGKKFVGQFNLEGSKTITFFRDKVVVE